jgi:drug/metabolite transporter (DMT)-like permease
MSDQPTPANRRYAITVILAFVAIYTIWGATYLAIRVAVDTIPPFLMAATRFLLVGILLFLFLRARGAPMPTRVHWRSAVIIGILLLVGGNGLVTWSEQQVPSSTAALVVATVPLWIALFDWLIFKGARPGKRVTFGIVLGLIGIGLLVGPGQVLGTADFSLTALLVLMLAPLLWSLGSLYSRTAELPDDVFMSMAMEMLAGGAVLLVAGLATGEAAQLNLAEISTQSWLALLYLTIFGSFVAYAAYIWLLQHVEATRVATYTYVNPVFAVFLGWLVLSEPITASTLVAVVIIILAVILITARTPEKTPERDTSNGHSNDAAFAARLAAETPESDSVAL